MSDNTVICRVCLTMGVRMHKITDTPLQSVYEKLVETELLSARRPLAVCYICYARLHKSYKLMLTAVRADTVVTAMLTECSKVTVQSVSKVDRQAAGLCGSLVISPAELDSLPPLTAEVKADDKTVFKHEALGSAEPASVAAHTVTEQCEADDDTDPAPLQYESDDVTDLKLCRCRQESLQCIIWGTLPTDAELQVGEDAGTLVDMTASADDDEDYHIEDPLLMTLQQVKELTEAELQTSEGSAEPASAAADTVAEQCKADDDTEPAPQHCEVNDDTDPAPQQCESDDDTDLAPLQYESDDDTDLELCHSRLERLQWIIWGTLPTDAELQVGEDSGTPVDMTASADNDEDDHKDNPLLMTLQQVIELTEAKMQTWEGSAEPASAAAGTIAEQCEADDDTHSAPQHCEVNDDTDPAPQQCESDDDTDLVPLQYESDDDTDLELCRCRQESLQWIIWGTLPTDAELQVGEGSAEPASAAADTVAKQCKADDDTDPAPQQCESDDDSDLAPLHYESNDDTDPFRTYFVFVEK